MIKTTSVSVEQDDLARGIGDALPAFISRWPGKSPAVEGGPPHPAAYHMLDVAAVAECLLALEPDFDAPAREAIAFLVALHDLGKIGEPFRDMLLHRQAQQHGRHWEATDPLLRQYDPLLAHIGGSRTARFRLYAAVAGHHGEPPWRESTEALLASCGPQALEDSQSLLQAYCALWPNASLASLSKDALFALGWWLPGMTATADWIGSNPNWFVPQEPGLSLPAYLEHARSIAPEAVKKAGLSACPPAEGQLFDFPLWPMQQACSEIELPDGPTLAFIEDETGAGKTEAALLLAQRMMLAGKGRGIFFALPTMATANAMFSRARNDVARMFAEPPNLTLAHGRAPLSKEWREMRAHKAAQEDTPGCTDWLADNRRRALLAQVGVGTIDQALMSILPTRFCTLRHYGLASKILIVDEVHEMGEAYIAEGLKTLLNAHRKAGGSAILITATLPLKLRTALAQAFGADAPKGSDYPALSVAGGAAKVDFGRTNAGGRGPVSVQRSPDNEAALNLIAESAARGAACVWVRNAVDDAIGAVLSLRSMGVDADLLHARYALCDRLRHEAKALGRFGKVGADRSGRVLVGTQVLESSLDLDFDVMVSDLAPMAALIQRAGRLWRHMVLRPVADRPVAAPVLYVVSPDPKSVADGKWLHQVLDKGAYVYPLDVQWRTANVLLTAGQIDAPSGLRALIEAVHGNVDPTDLPEAIQRSEQMRTGKEMSGANLAQSNVIKWEDGFRKAKGLDDTTYPTRLAPEQRTLLLVRMRSGGCEHWACGDAGTPPGATRAELDALSEVRASKAKLSKLAMPEQDSDAVKAFVSEWPKWKQKETLVCPVDEDGRISPGLRYDAELGLLFS